MKNFIKNINLILENNQLGSLGLINELIETCENFYETNQKNDIQIINNIVVDQMEKIAKSNVQMIAFYKLIHEIINTIHKDFSTSANILEYFSKYKHESNLYLEALSNNISAIVDAKTTRFLLHSSSSSIQHFFSKIANEGISVEIYQTISHPSKEGINQAKILANFGHKIKLIEDSAVGKFIDKIDFVLLGADAVLNELFINKIGTSCLCQASYKSKLPVFVVADTRKYISDSIENQEIIQSLLNEDSKSSSEILDEKVENIQVLNYYFENISSKLISGFINERGIFTTKSVKNLIKELDNLNT